MKAIRKSQAGWTLVEIIIVTVIVGLLLGAILVGKSVMDHSRGKSIINDFNGVTAAYQLYWDRYRARPGDDLNAASRWAGSVSGNGDQQIAGTWNAVPSSPPTASEESNLFWWHLKLAGFLTGPLTGPEAALAPPNAVHTRAGVQEANGALGLTGPLFCVTLPDQIAIQADNALDDGKPGSGTIRSMLGDSGTALVPATAMSYTETSGTVTTYVVCRQIFQLAK